MPLSMTYATPSVAVSPGPPEQYEDGTLLRVRAARRNDDDVQRQDSTGRRGPVLRHLHHTALQTLMRAMRVALFQGDAGCGHC